MVLLCLGSGFNCGDGEGGKNICRGIGKGRRAGALLKTNVAWEKGIVVEDLESGRGGVAVK